MYLKSIEVHGFKSFANKMTFEFHNGVDDVALAGAVRPDDRRDAVVEFEGHFIGK